MDHTNKVNHMLSQKSFSTYSKCVQEPKNLIKQEGNPMSNYPVTASSSDKHDYSKFYMKKNSSIKTETEAKGDDGIDYDVVKQFDELISELSRSEKHEEKSYSYNLCDLVEENIKNDVKGLNKKVSTSESYIDHSVSEIKASENTLDSSESNCMNNVVTEHYKLGYKSMSSKKRNEDQDTLLKGKGNISWIDSNLWSFGKEKQSYLFQKPVSKASKNVDMTDLSGSSKGVYSIPTQPATVNLGHMDILNHPAFYTAQASKKKDVKYSGYPSLVKNDYRRFPPSEAYLKEMNTCKSSFHPVRSNSTISLQNSPRTSRTPVSKYMLPNNCFVVKLFVETRDLHLGPFPFEIYPKMSLRLLKLKVEQEHSIVSSSQRWILGKCFAADNDKSLVDYNVMPGSSIILYVDNNQRVCYDASENQFFGVKNITSVNEKMFNNNAAEYNKELNKPEQIRTSELSVTNVFDSVPIHSCSKTEGYVRSQNNENIKEQCIVSTSGKEIWDNTKSPKIKKKGPKKGTELRKCKTKIVAQFPTDLPIDKCGEESFFDKSNVCYLDDVLPKEKKYSTENLLNSYQTETVFERECNQFQEAPLPVLITTNNSDISNEYNQPCSFTETATVLPSSLLKSPVEDIYFDALSETPQSFPLSNIIVDNLPGSSHFPISSQDLVKNSSEFMNQYEVRIKSNSRDEVEPESLNISQGRKYDEIIEGKFSIYNHGMNEGGNLEEISANISGKLNSEILFPIKYAENHENSNISSFERVEKVENSHNIESLENNILKPKRSVSSLIRKLSLTRKTRSLDDSSPSNNISSDKTYNERMDEKNFNQTTVISNQSQYNDIHIEISPENPDFLAVKDESVEQYDKEIPLEDHTVHNSDSIKNFELLLEIENMDLVENPTNFTCPVCFDEFESGQGVILHDCLHVFCRVCLTNAINYAEDAVVKCPYRDDFYSCPSHLQQREIKALVSEELYEKYLQRSIITAEGSEERSFHCKTLDCRGWCVYDNVINVFRCPVCFHYNCLNCQAIHEGLNCRQYQDKLKLQQKTDQDAQKTLELLNKMIEGGKAIRCPKCDLILMKKWGCDWLKCSICQTEICWITKGPRWGPGGQGDTSGGCRCGVNGVKCHPSCTYCH